MDHVSAAQPSRFHRGDLRLLRDLAHLEEAPATDVAAAPDPEQVAQAARRVADELAAKQVSLHFEVEPATNRVRIEVRSADGRIVREIPPRSLLEALAGRAGLLVDGHA